MEELGISERTLLLYVVEPTVLREEVAGALREAARLDGAAARREGEGCGERAGSRRGWSATCRPSNGFRRAAPIRATACGTDDGPCEVMRAPARGSALPSRQPTDRRAPPSGRRAGTRRPFRCPASARTRRRDA